jgi:integral membrane sensor domain MASE1
MVGVALAHAVSATTAWLAFGAYGGDPVFWPANGIVVTALVVLGRRYATWPWILAGGFVAEIVTSIAFGLEPAWAVAYAGANVVEIVVVAALFVRWCPERDLSTRRGLAAFVATALVIGPGLASLVGGALTMLDAGVAMDDAVVAWWTGDALGLLVVAAPLIAWAATDRTRSRARPAEWVAVHVAVAVLAAIPYVTTSQRLSSLPIAVLLWAAVRLGVLGTLTAGSVLAVVNEAFTARGLGFWVEQSSSVLSGQVALRLFLMVAVLTPWVLAVEVAHRQAAERREAGERLGRLTAEALTKRLSVLRALAEELSRAATPEDVERAWAVHAPGVLGGTRHRLSLTARRPRGMAPPPMEEVEAAAVARRGIVTEDRDGATVVAAPVLAGARVLGVLSFHSADDRHARDHEETAAVAARLADALVRIGLFEEVVESGRRLELLQELTSLLGRAPTTQAVVDTVLGAVRRAVGATAAGLVVRDRDGRLVERGSVGTVPAAVRGRDAGVAFPPGSPVAVAGSTGRAVREEHWSVLPLTVTGRIRGVAWFAWDPGADRDPWRLQDAAIGQSAAALARVTASDAEHDAAIQLQQALLPRRFPTIPHVAAAARYLPSQEALSVGGDWYDVVHRADGRTVVMVGDVVGHDVAAAAAMGQVRSVLSTIAAEADGPGQALDRLEAFPGGEAVGFATASCVEIEADGDGARLRYASAGHPPALLVRPGGEADFLMAGRSAPLFVLGETGRPVGTATAEPGSLLVCYTDGLIERPDRSLHDGMLALARACLVHRRRPLTDFTDRVLHEMTAGSPLADDVALIVVSMAAPQAPAAMTGARDGARAPRPNGPPAAASFARPPS